MKKNPTELPKLRIVQVAIDNLRSADYNPRSHDDVQKEHLKESIRRFGLVDPIIVNKSPERFNIIIGGHFRWLAAKELGYKEIPVVYVDIPNLEKEKELNLRLNRNTGEWDLEKLKSFDIDLLLDVGFNDADLASVWDDALGTEDDAFDEDEELKKIIEPKTKIGDFYKLGDHFLICGDATDPSVVERLVGDSKMEMIYTDPPYNISLDYNRGVGQQKQYGGKTDDDKTPEDYRKFLLSLMGNAIAFSKPDCHVFCWNDEKHIGLVQSVFTELGLENRRTCLWVKGSANVTPQVAFNKCYEACMYATRGSPYLSPSCQNLSELLNREIGSGNRAIDDILDILNIWLEKRLSSGEYEHPTQKPVTLHERPLRRCTQVDDSTLIACEQMKRKAFLCEVEPIFCDLIIRRFELATGLSASLIQP
jgi:DNA modification methylase